MRCGKCQSELSFDSGYCPYCGTKIDPYRNQQTQNPKSELSKLMPFVLIGVAIIVAAIILRLPGGDSQGNGAISNNNQMQSNSGYTQNNYNQVQNNNSQSQDEVHTHVWAAATCTMPKRCTACGATSGSAKGHTWADATFTAARTCTTCHETDGMCLSYENIYVEDEVTEIRRIYNDISKKSANNEYEQVKLREGVVANYDNYGNLAFVIVYRGTSGIGEYSKTYSRVYYYSEGELIFAFYEGKDSHRLYFYDELLMRWRYTAGPSADAVNHDFDFGREYFMWESLALAESETFF